MKIILFSEVRATILLIQIVLKPIFIDGGTNNDIISITGVAAGQSFHTVDGAEGDDDISGGAWQ